MIKYSHTESRKEFGANRVFLSIQLRVEEHLMQKLDNQT